MNEKKFDDIIKGKIDNLVTGNSDESWSAFESKWDAANVNSESENQEFDSLVRSKMVTHSQPFRESHWLQMKEHLKTIEERKNTVFFTKALEFAAIFLIVFTFSHLSNVINFDKPEITTQKNQFANIQSNKIQKDVQKPVIKLENKLPNKLWTKPKEQISLEQDIKESITPALVVEENVTFLSTKLDNPTVDPSSAIIALQQKEFESIRHIEPAGLNGKTDIQPNGMYDSDLNNTASLSSRQIKKPESEMARIFPMKLSHADPSTKYAVAAYASGDINLINTPFDKLYSLASYNKEALNKSYGVNFSAKKSHLELETGLGYAHRQYQPRLVTEAYGQFADHYFEKSLQKISYDIANIPLNIKYHFIHQTNWSAYLMAGVALNLILDAKYDINETLRQGKPPVGRFTPEQARLDEKPFITGILNGDNFNDNYFATIGFGFGIEKKIFGNTSLYVQPSYQRQILSSDIGIGPNKDKIHTSSLQFGVKTVIN
jgi:hypothetical protein